MGRERAAGATWVGAGGSVAFRCSGALALRRRSESTSAPLCGAVGRPASAPRTLSRAWPPGLSAGPPRGQQRDAGPGFGNEGRCGAGGAFCGSRSREPPRGGRSHEWRRACSWPPVCLTRPAGSSFTPRGLQPGSAAPWLPQGPPFIGVCCHWWTPSVCQLVGCTQCFLWCPLGSWEGGVRIFTDWETEAGRAKDPQVSHGGT